MDACVLTDLPAVFFKTNGLSLSTLNHISAVERDSYLSLAAEWCCDAARSDTLSKKKKKKTKLAGFMKKHDLESLSTEAGKAGLEIKTCQKRHHRKITSKCFGSLLHCYVIRDLIQNMLKLTKLSFYLIDLSVFAVFLESFILCLFVLWCCRSTAILSWHPTWFTTCIPGEWPQK